MDYPGNYFCEKIIKIQEDPSFLYKKKKKIGKNTDILNKYLKIKI